MRGRTPSLDRVRRAHAAYPDAVPELPEVERARAYVEAHGLGRRIAAADDRDSFVCRPHHAGELDAALRGATLTAALRRGKAMWFETDGGEGPTLGLHLGMTGRIVADLPAAPNRWDRFALDFEDGGRLALLDKRRLGRAVLNPDLSHLGPDAAEVSRDAFRKRVGRGGAPLKARIMDQTVIAGVGNLLADETLWQARLSPLRPAGDLTVEELDALRRTLRLCTKRAIRKGGVHTGEVILGRGRGQRCPRCKAEMARAVVGGRTTWFCPVEQS